MASPATTPQYFVILRPSTVGVVVTSMASDLPSFEPSCQSTAIAVPFERVSCVTTAAGVPAAGFQPPTHVATGEPLFH
jgi:hypothetical protein